MQPDNLDFVDDLVFLSHKLQRMQIKTSSLAVAFTSEGLSSHKRKTKHNTKKIITFDGDTMEEVETFTYLNSIIDEQGGSDADVITTIAKLRAAFLQLKNIWNSKQLSTNINVRIFNMNVKTIMLYEAETWRTTTTTIKKADVCHAYHVLRSKGIKPEHIITMMYDDIAHNKM
ncbi:unnamed protein product [Schistosoma mattheei]|uniref:Uncharacterized protein n=1 Tax=Schistosoma mattheei TaxID=31246 RepID=A0A183Q4V4_9TREM|nr:unnamed protein product [Schistosoma mattheei]